VSRASFREQVIAASGLSGVFAPSVIDRACKRASVDAATLDPPKLATALDSIEMALKLYLSDDEVRSRMTALRALARGRAA
jgi:hypothetical protein